MSLRRFIGHYDREVKRLDHEIHSWLRNDVGYREIQRLDGVGPVLAAVFVAEIGDIGMNGSGTASVASSLMGIDPTTGTGRYR